ncbi:MAG: PAS domain S-box protein [Phycisphaerae bacterium]|nr:PAS domain S-box protein [Phycisphaerae bacterium]
MLSDVLQYVAYGWIPVGLAVGGYVAYRLAYRAGGPLKRISRNLERVSQSIEGDLTQLQLADANELLSQGWNRLISEVVAARRELESYEVRRQALETVERYQQNWVRELLNHMPYGLLIASEDLVITFVNPTGERLVGQGQQELLDRGIVAVFGAPLESLRHSTGGTIDRTFDVTAQDRPLRLNVIKIDGEGGGGQIALFVRDMSHQKEIEQARDQFLYHVSHELRTPLTNIRAYAETLSEGVLEDRDSLRECYNVIVSETDRLARLVEDILDVSQLEAGSARLDSDDVQTARLIRQVVEDMQASADDKNVELLLSMPPKVPTIMGDKERLAVVLTNLVGNAIKYTPSGGQVEVSCVEDGARLMIKVRDTGIGIAPEDQSRVFQKFFRASNEEVAKLPGTGLGLAIALSTVRSHGGTIELVSATGKGSTFTVSLPIGKQSKISAGESKSWPSS